jgi:hypothetical protein
MRWGPLITLLERGSEHVRFQGNARIQFVELVFEMEMQVRPYVNSPTSAVYPDLDSLDAYDHGTVQCILIFNARQACLQVQSSGISV